MDRQHIIVLGAGVGGLTTANYLAREGFRVTVFEKNETPGGRCSNMVIDGHRFDTGATLLMMTRVYEKAWADMGKDLHTELDLMRMDPIYRIKFHDGTDLRVSSDLYRLQKEIDKADPGSYSRFLDYMQESYRSYEWAMKHIIDRNYNGFFDFFNPKNFYLLYRTKAFQNHYRHSGKFFRNRFLRIAFSFQNIYVGQNPMTASAIFSMLPFLELTDGVWYPRGGMNSITESLTRMAEQNGVKITCRAPVSQIMVEGNRTTGVLLEDGTRMDADMVVCNADLPYAYQHLLPASRTARRIGKLKYTCSAFMFHWGMDRQFPEFEQHNVFVSENYDQSIRQVFEHKDIPDEPSFYIHSQVKLDKSAAPAGQDSISSIVPVGHLVDGRTYDWDEITQRVRTAVFERLAREGIPDFEKHIKFEKVFTPETWAGRLNLSRGATFGSLNHNIFQMGYMRPHNQHHKYRNLFFVGGSTHPGNGVPMCLLSAKLTTARIKELTQTT